MKPKRTKAKEDTFSYLRRIVTELDNIEGCLLKEGGYYSVRALAAARKGLIEAGHMALFLNHCTVIREDFPGYVAPEPGRVEVYTSAPMAYNLDSEDEDDAS